MDLSEINVGVGYGLRIRLPVINAPIKLDLAYPIVNNQDYESTNCASTSTWDFRTDERRIEI